MTDYTHPLETVSSLQDLLNMTRHTKTNVKECMDYLRYCYKEGTIDESEVAEIIKTKDWDRVYNMMAKADAFANNYHKEEK